MNKLQRLVKEIKSIFDSKLDGMSTNSFRVVITLAQFY